MGDRLMFRAFSRGRAADEAPALVTGGHVVTSEFSTATCRFTLCCTCGAAFDTNHIDEALEWHELHMTLAPLVDQLDAAAPAA
jgi:hypothetical protein